MNMYEELKAWADKWGVKYTEYPATEAETEDWALDMIYFNDCCDNQEPAFGYDPKTGHHTWYGGE